MHWQNNNNNNEDEDDEENNNNNEKTLILFQFRLTKKECQNSIDKIG